MAFDLLRLKGDDLRLRPIEAGPEALVQLVGGVDGILFGEARRRGRVLREYRRKRREGWRRLCWMKSGKGGRLRSRFSTAARMPRPPFGQAPPPCIETFRTDALPDALKVSMSLAQLCADRDDSDGVGLVHGLPQ
jgi:hypothetical protein